MPFTSAPLRTRVSLAAFFAAAAGAMLLQGCASAPGVTPVSAAGADSLRRSSTARVVLLNVWATWCKPCLEEMPGLVRLRSEYSRDDLDLILLSADDLSDVDTAVAPFLGKAGVDFPTYVFGGGDQDAFIRTFDTTWSGALPATFLSSRPSGASRTLVGERSYEQFKAEIDALLAR
jgi:thiol-disulfide isomerase/thioredoxin